MSHGFGRIAETVGAKRLIRRIANSVERHVADHGDVDLHEIADILSLALASESDRAALLLGLAEYLAAAVNGTPIQLDAWTPVRAAMRRANH